jgi:alkylation response protein AidB-like acyl-CoA dehydrogenase
MDMRRITATADAGMVIARGDPARSWWTTSVSLARRAISVQMCGLLATMLDMARLHAIDRHQFGRPVGSFQAIRHKLAEAAVALAAAEGVADAAWESDDQPLASLVSKVVVSRACTTVAAHTQQVLAGMGFTADHSYHQVMKRAVVLDRLFGDANELLPVLGRQLMARGAAPRLVEL